MKRQKKTNDDGRLLAVLKHLKQSKINTKKSRYSEKLQMIFESALDIVERKAYEGTLTPQEIKAVLSLMKKFNIKGINDSEDRQGQLTDD